MDIVIINTFLITLRGNGLGIIEDGAIGISDKKITFVGRTKECNHKNYDMIIDGTNHVTLPGLINTHIHSGLTLLRGGAQDLPEIEWMNKGLGPFVKHLTPKDLVLGSKLGVLEGVRTGTTTFAEYSQNVSRIIKEVYIPFNVRVVAIETINEISIDRSRLNPKDLYEFDHDKGISDLKRANELFETYKNNEMVDSLYGPQALDMISLDLLHEVKRQATEKNTKLHMHVAQGKRERIQIKGRYGIDTSTISVLENESLLDKSLIAAHLHDTSAEERKLLVKRAVNMVGCPSSISMIDGIVPPINHYLELGGISALGTDQAPGPGHHNLFQEMRMASVLTKVIQKDPTALPAWQSLKLGTINGASVLGVSHKIGSLEVGKLADVIMIDLLKINLTPNIKKPFCNIIPNLIYSIKGNEVDNVIINGTIVLKDNQFTNINEESIIKEANERGKQIFEKGTNDWLEAGSKMVSYSREGFI
ncbi:MAG: amidohydrolase family protein [Candidatus Hodarchaeota archaeon]